MADRQTWLDGLRSGMSHELVPPSLGRRPRRRFWIGLVVMLGLTLAVGVAWVRPILAAFPIERLSDTSALIDLMKPGRYLILFQNPRELRSTGGFLGSFADVEVGWGLRVRHIEVETNIYTRDAEYAAKLRQEPPAALKTLLGDQPWALRDSNWPIDYPEAAALIAWFYEQEGGRPVDGVIVTDTRLLERLLRETGSINLPEHELTLTAENVVDLLVEEIEDGYWEELEQRIINEPKSILADLLPPLLDRIQGQPLRILASLMSAAFEEKEMLAWFRRPSLARSMEELNWDGHLRTDRAHEFIYLNESNLTYVPDRLRDQIGAKSSWSIDRALEIDRQPTPSGTVLVRLTLYRQHSGAAVWPDGPNQSYLRVAVPAGSRLVTLDRNNQEIESEIQTTREAGATVFGVWSRLEPLEREVIHIVYETAAADRLIIQRQPGVPSFPVSLSSDGSEVWQGELDQDEEIALPSVRG